MTEDEWHATGLTVGQVARRMGIAPSAVRWYDDHGLLPSERTSGNQRRFFADVLCRVAMIKAAQRTGLSIEEIREALTFLPPREAPTRDDWDRLAAHLRDAAGRRVSELLAILSELSPADQTRTQPTPPGAAGDVHAWRIEEREYARQEKRRGRRHAFETLEPARTALVVIDMMPFFVTGARYGPGIVPGINRIAGALRAAGGTVAWVVPAADRVAVSEEFFGPEVAATFRGAGGRGLVQDRICAGLEVHHQDLLADKSSFSAFFPGSSPLPGKLEERGITTVLVTGMMTNVCCESSARDASALGYRVIMVADANATVSDHEHNATLTTIYRSFGDVRPAADVIAMIESAAGSG